MAGKRLLKRFPAVFLMALGLLVFLNAVQANATPIQSHLGKLISRSVQQPVESRTARKLSPVRKADTIKDVPFDKLRAGSPLGLKKGCENCAVPQPPHQAQKRRSLGTPVRDSSIFATLSRAHALG